MTIEVPNITGRLQGYRRILVHEFPIGAFSSWGDTGYDWFPENYVMTENSFGFEFSAANDNAIYTGSTVQPKALNVLACIRA